MAKCLSVYRGYISELERNHVGRIRTVAAGARRTTAGTMAEEEGKGYACLPTFPAVGVAPPTTYCTSTYSTGLAQRLPGRDKQLGRRRGPARETLYPRDSWEVYV